MYRIIWRYRPDVLGPVRWSSPPRPLPHLDRTHAVFRDRALLLRPRPVFREPAWWLRQKLAGLYDRRVDLRGDPLLDLATFAHAFVRLEADAVRLRDRLRNEPGVAGVQIQTRPVVPLEVDVPLEQLPRPSSLDHYHPPGPGVPYSNAGNYVARQGYLETAAAGGIDARAAWAVPGGRGAGVTIVDVEFGWNRDHVDLQSQLGSQVCGANVDVRPDLRDHGAAVLGVFGGDRNAAGVTGIAHDALTRTASPVDDANDTTWNVAGAIHAAQLATTPGDVIVLELQYLARPLFDGGAAKGWVPVEASDAELGAIRTALAEGRYVVEAAANGGHSLDAPELKNRFARDRDSGAILVGGGAPPNPGPTAARQWLSLSNYGARVDVQGWGAGVVTTGGTSGNYGDLTPAEGDPDNCYTETFRGTSSATAMVAGAVACLSGAVRRARGSALPPERMREVLVATGSAQPATDAEHIGPLPDLARGLAELL